MYPVLQRFRQWLGKISIFWLALLGFATMLLWSQISLSAENLDEPQLMRSRRYPIELVAQAATQLDVSCSQVSYGQLANSNQQKIPLAALPLNELIIELDRPHFSTPPAPSGPTQVGISLFVEEVAELSASDNSYAMEGFLDLIWCDPRSSFEPEKVGWHQKIFLEKDAEKELERIWWPDYG